jgi:hypothetical protein
MHPSTTEQNRCADNLQNGRSGYRLRQEPSRESLLHTLSVAMPNTRMNILREWDVGSAGDQTIVMATSLRGLQRAEARLTGCRIEKLSRTDNIWVIANERHQAILRLSADDSFHFMVDYLSWGRLGALIGDACLPPGYMMNEKGLWYYDSEDQEQSSNKLLVTQYFPGVLKFLGYDPSVFQTGFKSRKMALRYLSSSAFFTLNRLQGMGENDIPCMNGVSAPLYNGCHQLINRTRSQWLSMASTCFPAFAMSLRYEKEMRLRKLKMGGRFNRQIVSEIADIDGVELDILLAILESESAKLGGLLSWTEKLSDKQIAKWVLEIREAWLPACVA